jgi:hypothetical protein
VFASIFTEHTTDRIRQRFPGRTSRYQQSTLFNSAFAPCWPRFHAFFSEGVAPEHPDVFGPSLCAFRSPADDRCQQTIDPAQACAASCNASMRGLADAGLKAELRVMRSNGGLAAPGTVADLTGEATISPRREVTGAFRISTNPTTANWLSRCLTDVGLELVETSR